MVGHKKKMWYYESISLLLWGIMCRKNEIKSYRYEVSEDEYHTINIVEKPYTT